MTKLKVSLCFKSLSYILILNLLFLFTSCKPEVFPNCNFGSSDEIEFQKKFGLAMFCDYENGLACAKKHQKPIFTYFTSYSNTVKEFERSFVRDEEIRNTLNNNFICIILHGDDQTPIGNVNKEKVIALGIAEEGFDFLQQNKTMGVFNGLLQRYKFVNVKQPLYTIQNSQGKILMTPMAYMNSNIESFKDFLSQGIKENAATSKN